jgi:predicted amidohydrolase
MKTTIGLAQTIHPTDANTLAVVERFAAQAHEAGIDLLVFPESLMSRYEAEKAQFLREAEVLDGPFSTAVCEIAARYGLWMVYTMNEKNPAGGNPFNTAVVVDSSGARQGVYRKVHLFDTSFTKESDRMQAGSSFFDVLETPFGKLGLGICYDLRFPEQARAAALAGADIMIYPAAWVDGKTKAEQWHTLLAARAIENEMFVVGVSRADEGYIGQSAVANPYGILVASGGPGEELITCTIDISLRKQVYEGMPVFDHRRTDIY